MSLDRIAVENVRDAARNADGDDYGSWDAFCERAQPGIVLELAEFWLETSDGTPTVPAHQGEKP